ncbi:MAG: RluA family pseudouridine synthase, partial [Lachnospiraceae bacterium]|nr:RluA family pseudouridine synthase [Lachnospiraceae bacterium]
MKIIHEDSQILVCYKESGLPVQSARVGTKDMVSMLKTYLWEKGGSGKEPYLGVIHRLDQPVEGVVVFAKTAQAAASLSEQIRNGSMQKIYHAVVRKNRNDIPDQGLLINYLLKESKGNSSKIVPEKTTGAKQAELEYRILKKSAGNEKKRMALVQIHLHTGRHHQIRVQMAGADMPLYGDRKYGIVSPEDSKSPLALCAVSLCFHHPKSKELVTFTCE